jgi:hypothetical protein
MEFVTEGAESYLWPLTLSILKGLQFSRNSTSKFP